MRSLPLVLTLVALPVPALADNFVDFIGGIQAPQADDTWTGLVETSPKVGARFGVMNEMFGGMLSVDWTPEKTETKGTSFPGGSTDVSAHRFRVLAQALARQHLAPKINLYERVGAGLDLAYASYDYTVLGNSGGQSDWDAGFGFEFGAGVWIDLTHSLSIGGEVAMPIGYHSHKQDSATDIAFDYTSFDVDVMFGLRIWSR